VDIWGFAGWMEHLRHKPDGFISTPPDSRWGINWDTDPNFPIERNLHRMKQIMDADVARFGKVMYMIDHPNPFLHTFSKFPDERQAHLTLLLKKLSEDVGASFIVRSYSEVPERLGPKTLEVLTRICNSGR
jgi:hypothetical protein